MWIVIPVYAAFFALMLLASRHVELRPTRWIKIAISTPVILYMASRLRLSNAEIGESMRSVVLCFLFLIFVWRGNISFLLAVAFTDYLTGRATRYTGARADYRFVASAMKENDHETALELLDAELEKDIYRFEGLQYLAQILAEREHLEAAITVLSFGKKNPDLMGAQGEVLEIEIGNLQSRLSARTGKPPKMSIKSKSLARILRIEKGGRAAFQL
jgi:hypothetical protein